MDLHGAKRAWYGPCRLGQRNFDRCIDTQYRRGLCIVLYCIWGLVICSKKGLQWAVAGGNETPLVISVRPLVVRADGPTAIETKLNISCNIAPFVLRSIQPQPS